MNEKMLREHLAEAEAQVAKGLKHLAEQRAVIAELERDGHDTKTARELFATLMQSQELHIEHRDRLKRELGIP
jgi:hypothetical protein